MGDCLAMPGAAKCVGGVNGERLKLRNRKAEFEFQSVSLHSLTQIPLDEHESKRDMISQVCHIRLYQHTLGMPGRRQTS